MPAATWVHLENTVPSGKSQMQKATCFLIPFM